MQPTAELSDFLRTRRARLTPADAGLPSYGGRRRAPGLRREELAALAGHRRARGRQPAAPRGVRASVLSLFAAMQDVPAVVLRSSGRRSGGRFLSLGSG